MRDNTLSGTHLGKFAEQAVKEPTAFTAAHRTFEEARALADRCEELAAQLLGPTPADALSPGGLSGPGALPALEDHAVSTSRAISNGFAALSRIERAL